MLKYDSSDNVYIKYTPDEGKEGVKIQKLPEIVTHKNGIFELIKRTEKVALYRKTHFKDGGKFYPCSYDYFEVFIIEKMNLKNYYKFISKKRNINYNLDEIDDFKEKFPSDEDFGKTAWAFRSLEDSNNKFDFLVSKLSGDKKNGD